MTVTSKARLALALAATLCLASPSAAQPGTAFTYQGRLSDSGAPANGSYDLEMKLFSALTGVSQIGPTLTLQDVAVTAGLFSVSLDFGSVFSTGSKRWLEIGVRAGISNGPFTPLSPRQELTPTPNALFSVSAGDAASLGGLTAAAYFQVSSVVPVASGGTGAVSAGGARTNLGAAARGANSDITSLSGLTTPLSLAQGGTGSATAAGARTALGAQALVTGACAAGSSIQTINPDGTVVCRGGSAQPGFTLTTVDSAGDVGITPSVTIGADGLGLISYFDSTNLDLKVAHCSNAACSSATTAALDSTGDVGSHASVTIGTDGLGLISYYDVTNKDLKVAHCSNTACSSATTATIDSTGDVGRHTAVTIGADGLGLISYFNQTTFDLKVAHCSNAACSSATTATLDGGPAQVGEYSSIAIGADGLGLISYFSQTDQALKVAHCSDTACSSATIATLDTLGGSYNSLTIGADGLGLISYLGNLANNLKVAHCADAACSSASTATVDTEGNAGYYTSVTIGADGLGLISYFGFVNQDLKVAHCSNTACSSATTATLDSPGMVAFGTSLTTGADGLGLIALYDFTTLDLKVAHCSNPLCSPFVARRR